MVDAGTLELARMFFGVHLGGAVAASSYKQASAISASFRGATMLQEVVNGWLLPEQDKGQASWAHETGNNITKLDGVCGSYLNEVDPALQAGEYEERFWG